MRVLFILVFCQSIIGQIRITEIMYDLDGTDSPNEFVELYNLSPIDTVDLTGWTIRDRFSTDELIDSGYGLKIPPLTFGIIFEGDYNFASGIYADSIPASAILIKVDDSSIGNGFSTADSVYLVDEDGFAQDSVGWSDIAPDGFSIEKVRIEMANTVNNWLTSLDSLGTPGSENSVEPFHVDGELISASLTATPTVIYSNENITISGKVANQGRSAISGEVEILSGNDILESVLIDSLNELDTVFFSTELGPFTSGYHLLGIRFMVNNDENSANNSASLAFGVRYASGLIMINEFLPYPMTGGLEFIELYYHGTNTLNLSGWGITDATGNITEMSGFLDHQRYIAAADDSSFLYLVPDSSLTIITASSMPGLNNSGDEIKLLDPFGTLIDSLFYSDFWDIAQGRSLEKIFPDLISADSSHWLVSYDSSGFTPGRRNSVMPWPADGKIVFDEITYSPPFPSESDSIHFLIPVVNTGLTTLNGNLYIEYHEEELASTSIALESNMDTMFIDLGIDALSAGEHELFLALDVLYDGNPADNFGIIKVLVRYHFGAVKLNEFMARPNNDQSEFIELVSFDTIQISNWSFSDNSRLPKSLPGFSAFPGDYIVLAPDSSLHPLNNPAARLIIPNDDWAALNNSGDAIYIYDQTGSIIDSLQFDIFWPVADEISTEKLRPEFQSDQMNNWGVSIHSSCATPGDANSISLFDLDGALLGDSTYHVPGYPTPDESITLFIFIVNKSVNQFAGSVLINIDDEVYGTSAFPMITPGDTLVKGMIISPLLSGFHTARLQLQIAGDENSTNDSASDSIWISYEPGVVRLNEFLALPDSQKSEFVELVATDEVQMDYWSISDNSNSRRYFSFGDVIKNEFLVLAADSQLSSFMVENAQWLIPVGGLPGLNNDNDKIFLYDMTGMIIDSLAYNENWNVVENRSLEKYRTEYDSNDPSRWAVAVNEIGLTPGTTNSVYYEGLVKEGKLNIFPNPFSPDGDGIDDILKIQYKLPFEYGTISVQIFDVLGREIAVPFWNTFTAQEHLVTWDGRDKNGKVARIGPYIIRIKSKATTGGKTWEDVQTIILAKKL